MRLINEQTEWYWTYEYIRSRSNDMADSIDFTFDSRISLTDFTRQILFCWFKKITAMQLPRMNISYYTKDKYGEVEDQSKLVKRMRKIALDRNERDLMRLGISKVNPYAEMLRELSPQKQGQSSGYHMSKLDIETFLNSARNTGLPIIALLKDGMIIDAKRASGEKIKDAYMDWGRYLKGQAEEDDPKCWLYNLLDVASLETSLCPSFLYQIACYMEDNNIKTVPEIICALAGVCAVYIPGGTIRVQSRFLMQRESLIPFVFQEDTETVSEYLIKLLILHWGIMHEVQNTPEVYETIEKLPEEQKADYLQKWYNIMNVSYDESRFTPSFIKKLREAARAITDPQLYQNKKSDTVPRSK